MKILIKTLNNECFKVTCEPNDTVRHVKDSVAKTLKCDVGSVRLILSGQQLADEQTLSQAGVREENHLGVVILKVSSPEKLELEVRRSRIKPLQDCSQGLPALPHFQKQSPHTKLHVLRQLQWAPR